jgi:hypothetical protein
MHARKGEMGCRKPKQGHRPPEKGHRPVKQGHRPPKMGCRPGRCPIFPGRWAFSGGREGCLGSRWLFLTSRAPGKGSNRRAATIRPRTSGRRADVIAIPKRVGALLRAALRGPTCRSATSSTGLVAIVALRRFARAPAGGGRMSLRYRNGWVPSFAPLCAARLVAARQVLPGR